jgi:tRNA threonylcarbamoyl adenosine modification protein (Sua5/YciO/YrdC/YwlC family)
VTGDPGQPNEGLEAHARRAAEAILAGLLVVFPTDTVMALAARPDDPAATGALFAAKERPAELALPVLCADVASAWTVAEAPSEARTLGAAFWPGALTLVLSRTERSATWALGPSPATVAVRVPDHPLALAIASLAGPVAATSANRSGRPPLQGREELQATFGDRVAVYLVDEPGLPPVGGSASTVVDLTGPSPRVLRAGPVSEAGILSAIRRTAR